MKKFGINLYNNLRIIEIQFLAYQAVASFYKTFGRFDLNCGSPQWSYRLVLLPTDDDCPVVAFLCIYSGLNSPDWSTVWPISGSSFQCKSAVLLRNPNSIFEASDNKLCSTLKFLLSNRIWRSQSLLGADVW